MDIILLAIAFISLFACLHALQLIKHAHKPRNGEERKLREINEKMKL